MSPDSMTQVVSHAKENHVCGSATHAWVENVVFTHTSLARESSLPVSSTP